MTVDDERGVTLVELLISVTLLGIVVGTLSFSLIVGFKTTRDTQTQLEQSTGEQLVATWLTKDIQEADTIATPPGTTCSPQALLSLRSRSEPTGSVDTTTSYTKVGSTLVRRVCVDHEDAVEHTIADPIVSFVPAPCGNADSTCTVTIVAHGSDSNPDIGEYEYSIVAYRRHL